MRCALVESLSLEHIEIAIDDRLACDPGVVAGAAGRILRWISGLSLAVLPDW